MLYNEKNGKLQTCLHDQKNEQRFINLKYNIAPMTIIFDLLCIMSIFG